MPKSKTQDGKLTLGMVVFEGFELLDAFGPLQMFGLLRDKISIVIIGEKGETVMSNAGPDLKLDYTFSTAPKIYIIMTSGAIGTLFVVNN